MKSCDAKKQSLKYTAIRNKTIISSVNVRKSGVICGFIGIF